VNEIKIREMDKSETPLLVRWLYLHKETNLVDFEPFRRNQVRIYVAEDPTGILCFIPVRCDFHYDAIGPRPDLADFRLARAFQAMNEFLVRQAKEDNVGKIVAEPSDTRFSAFLQNELGFKENTRTVLEFNVNKMETAKCQVE
jgi:hypothetical protein